MTITSMWQQHYVLVEVLLQNQQMFLASLLGITRKGVSLFRILHVQLELRMLINCRIGEIC